MCALRLLTEEVWHVCACLFSCSHRMVNVSYLFECSYRMINAAYNRMSVPFLPPLLSIVISSSYVFLSFVFVSSRFHLRFVLLSSQFLVTLVLFSYIAYNPPYGLPHFLGSLSGYPFPSTGDKCSPRKYRGRCVPALH